MKNEWMKPCANAIGIVWGFGREGLRYRAHSAVLVALAALAFPVLATELEGRADRTESALDRFELLNDCRPMYLLVEHLSAEASRIGLTAGSVEVAVRSRLRAARLYTDNRSGAYLYVNVNVSANVASATLDFKKLVVDPASGVTGPATTWQRGFVATHASDAAFVRGGIAGMVDEFIDAYLRVNQQAC